MAPSRQMTDGEWLATAAGWAIVTMILLFVVGVTAAVWYFLQIVKG